MQYGWPWPFSDSAGQDVPYDVHFDASVNSGAWTGGLDQPSYTCYRGDAVPSGTGNFANYEGFAKCEYVIATGQFYQPASMLVTYIESIIQRESSFTEVGPSSDE